MDASLIAGQKPLPLEFYRKPTLTVATDLIGCYLHRVVAVDSLPEGAREVALEQAVDGRVELVGRIVETEGYLGANDDAAHTYRGPTPRTQVMFGPPGHAYIYLIYGMYWCLNIVTEDPGVGEAVLVRGLEPVRGQEVMQALRGGRKQIADGPGKLCQALDITGALNKVSLLGDQLFVTGRTGPASWETTPRIGIDYAQKHRDELWRFVAT